MTAATVEAPAPALTSAQRDAVDAIGIAQIRIKALVTMIECAMESAANPEGGTYTPTHSDTLEVCGLIHQLADDSHKATRAL